MHLASPHLRPLPVSSAISDAHPRRPLNVPIVLLERRVHEWRCTPRLRLSYLELIADANPNVTVMMPDVRPSLLPIKYSAIRRNLALVQMNELPLPPAPARGWRMGVPVLSTVR